MTHLLVATRNLGKLHEYRTLLAGLPITWLSLQKAGLADLHVAETGTTFAENACLKATTYARASGYLTLADDSGLEVDALKGAPGVYSARYAATDTDRCHKLLEALAGVPDAQRTARFRCVVAIATPAGETRTAQGICAGRIAHAPRGEYGFGYDPLFIVAGRDQTMAELTTDEKNSLSHRARALSAARPILMQYLEKG